MSISRSLRAVLSLLAAVMCLLLAERAARAEGIGAHAEPECNGPPECCITDRAKVTASLPETVRVGVRVMRLSKIDEREANYSADLYIMRRWPAGGIKPNLSLRNVTDTPNIVEDRLDKVGDFCYSARRFQDQFESPYLLKRFPFDKQKLRLALEDETWEPELIKYEDDLWPLSISQDAYRDLQSWDFEDYPDMRQLDANFRFHPGDVPSRILMVEIPVQREWQFYITRYFLPLLLIVCLSYSLFYIKPDDLASASGIGITAVLAIIAFQITQSDTLPKVGYLTLADKVYTVCYLFTAGAMAMIIHGAYLATHGNEEKANSLYRKYRVFFPIAFVVLFCAAGVWGYTAGAGESDDDPNTLAPAAAPSGEKSY
jgi:hypothetical protein